MQILLEIIICVIVAILLLNCFWQAIISYEIKDERLIVLFLKFIPLYETTLSSISRVEIWPWYKLFTSLDIIWLGNRYWGKRPVCIIQQNKAIFGKIIITPANPESFAETLLNEKHA